MVNVRAGVAMIALGVMAGGGAGCSDGTAAPRTVTITIRPLASEVSFPLLAFRDGIDAAWQTLTPTGGGRYEIMVHGPYTVEAVFTNGHGASTREVSRTLEDAPTVDLSSLVPTASADPPSVLRGTMAQTGSVYLGDSFGYNSDGKPAFEIGIGDGTYDLVAKVEQPTPRVVIRRGVTVAGPTTLSPAIDAIQEGAALVSVPVTVTNLAPNEGPSVNNSLVTASTTAWLNYDPQLLIAQLAPDSVLRPGDAQYIQVWGGRVRRTRNISRRVVAGGSTAFTLPEPPAVQVAAVAGRLVATWDTLAPYDHLTLHAAQASDAEGSGFIILQREVSVSYLAASGDTSASFDADLPGYDPAWGFHVAMPWQVFVDARGSDGQGGGIETYTTSGDSLPVRRSPATSTSASPATSRD
jgi:hypothetical protein